MRPYGIISADQDTAELAARRKADANRINNEAYATGVQHGGLAAMQTLASMFPNNAPQYNPMQNYGDVGTFNQTPQDRAADKLRYLHFLQNQAANLQ